MHICKRTSPNLFVCNLFTKRKQIYIFLQYENRKREHRYPNILPDFLFSLHRTKCHITRQKTKKLISKSKYSSNLDNIEYR